MTRLLSFFGLFLTLIGSSVSASADKLQCEATLIEREKEGGSVPSISRRSELAPPVAVVLEPRSEFGRKLSSFSIQTASSSSDVSENLNVCVRRQDYRKAKFRGAVCLIALSGTLRPGDSMSSLLFSVIRGREKPYQGGSLIEDHDSGEVTIPLPPDSEYVRWRQILGASSARGQDLILDIECRR